MDILYHKRICIAFSLLQSLLVAETFDESFVCKIGQCNEVRISKVCPLILSQSVVLPALVSWTGSRQISSSLASLQRKTSTEQLEHKVSTLQSHLVRPPTFWTNCSHVHVCVTGWEK